MLTRATSTIQRAFCVEAGLEKLYEMIFQVKDVTVVKGIQTDKPYFLMDRKKI